MHNRILKRNKHIRLKKKRILQKIILIILSFSSLFAVILWGAHNQNIRITNIYIEGNSAVLGKDIKERVLMDLDNKYLGLFPKDNILIYPKEQIKQDILSMFKRIYYIKINIIDLNSIVITIKERDPYALWCGENQFDGKKIILNSCFYMDNTGFIFASAPNFSDNVYFTVYGKLQETSLEQNISNNPIGRHFFEKTYFENLMLLRDALLNEGVDVKYLTFQKNNDINLFIVTGGKIIFNKKQDIEKIFRDLISAVDAKKAGGEKIWRNLEYIDIRFGNKVLFKFL